MDQPPSAALALFPADARRNVLVTLLGRGALIGLNLLATLVVIRSLGRDRYGVYVVLLSIITLPDMALEVSLFEVAVREMAKAPARVAEWLGVTTLVRGVVGLVLSLSLLVVPWCVPLDGEVADAVRVGAVLFLFNSFRTPVTLFRARLRIHWELGLSILARSLEVSLLVLVVQTGGGPAAFLGAKAVAAGCFVGSVWTALRWRFRLPPRAGLALVRPLLEYALPVGVAFGLFLFQIKGDVLLIDWVLGPASAGGFGAMVQVLEFVVVLNSVLAATTGPLLARNLGAGNTQQFQAVFQGLFDTLVTVLPGIALVACLFAGPIVRLGFGDDYTAFVPEFRVLVWVGALFPVSSLMGLMALTLNLQRRMVRVELVNVLVYVAANLVLLPWVGTIASAWIRLLVLASEGVWAYALIRAHSPYRLSLRRLTPAAVPNLLTALASSRRKQ